MKITVAKTAGFCMGVRRAVDMVLDAANLSEGPIYTYGPLIHNPQVLEMLETKGISKIDTIPEKGDGIVLVRAHGVPPQDEEALERAGFTVINATCPRVTRVQVIIDRYAQKGFHTIIIGDKKHPEVVGLLGYAKGLGVTVTSMAQLRDLPGFDEAVVVAQTTQNTAFYEEIKAWCREHRPHYKLFDTICGSTERRQSEVRDLARSHDAVIVVGGKQSGNTKRLAQVAKETQTPATHIEEISEIDFNQLSGANAIAITAGASTPNWIISDTCAQVTRNLQKRRPFTGFLAQARDFLLKTNIYLALGAGSLTYACSVMQSLSQVLVHSAVAMLYVLSMQVLNNIFTIKSDSYNRPDRAAFYRQYRSFLAALAMSSGLAGLYLVSTAGIGSFCILLVMSLLGLSYNLKIVPRKVEKEQVAQRGTGRMNRRITRIKDVPGSKTILITMAWGIVTSILPAVANDGAPLPVAAAFLYATGLVFARTAFFDVLAIQGDRIAGKETLPILLGEKQSFVLIRYVLAAACCIPPALAGMDVLPLSSGIALALAPLYMLLLIRFCEKGKLLSGVQYEFLIESSFLLAGVLVAVM